MKAMGHAHKDERERIYIKESGGMRRMYSCTCLPFVEFGAGQIAEGLMQEQITMMDNLKSPATSFIRCKIF